MKDRREIHLTYPVSRREQISHLQVLNITPRQNKRGDRFSGHLWVKASIVIPILLSMLFLFCGCPSGSPDRFVVMDENNSPMLVVYSDGLIQPYVPLYTQSENLSENEEHPEFIVRDPDGLTVFRADGHDKEIHLMGDIIHEANLTASEVPEFIITNSNDEVQAIIDSDGNLMYKGRVGMLMERTAPEIYNPCGTMDITLTLHYYDDETITALGIEETLPEGWVYEELLNYDAFPSIEPSTGDYVLEFAWVRSFDKNDFPLSISYRVSVPGSAQGDHLIEGFALYRTFDPEYQSNSITTTLTEGMPIEGECDETEGERLLRGQDIYQRTLMEAGRGESECILTGCNGDCHSGDINGNLFISLSELLRVVQYYEHRNSGGYHCESESDDGYAPGPGDLNCTPHDVDYNPQDWYINLSELLRFIQFYNVIGYYPCPLESTEDGFCTYRITVDFKDNRNPLYVTLNDVMFSVNAPENITAIDNYTKNSIDLSCFDIEIFDDVDISEVGTYQINYRLSIPFVKEMVGKESKKINLTQTVHVVDYIVFNDVAFKPFVRDITGIHEGEIYPEDVDDITTLWAIDLGIENLSGIQYFIGLEEIRLDMNNLRSLDWLVDAHNNPIFTNLIKLSIPGDNPIMNDSRGSNRITDLSPLDEYENLIHLDLRGSNERFSGLPELCEELVNRDKDYGNNIYDISPLRDLESLKYLNLSGNRICDISALENLNDLETLILSNNYLGIKSGALAAAKWEDKVNLKRLQLDFNELENGGQGDNDIASLENLPGSLQHLDVHGNRIQDISGLSPNDELQNLVELNLFQNQISSIASSRIPFMGSLRFLYLGRNVSLDSIQALVDNIPVSLERLNFLDNSETGNIQSQILALRENNIVVLARDNYLPSCEEKKGFGVTYYRFQVYYNIEGDFNLLSMREVVGYPPKIYGTIGEHGTLKITDVYSIITEVPINAPLELEVGNGAEEDVYLEVLEETIFHIDVPKTGEIALIEYIPPAQFGKSATPLDEPTYVIDFAPGVPIPISCRRIWPPENVEVCGNFTAVLNGTDLVS